VDFRAQAVRTRDVRVLALPLLACLLAACSISGGAKTFTGNGVTFRYPSGWDVAGFSTTNSPRRLAIASYAIPEDAVEGDCGGLRAVELLPPAGALVLLIDYGSELRSFPPRPEELALSEGAFAEYECFGASTLFRFQVSDRALQAHVVLGPDTSDGMRDRALAILESLEVEEPTRFEPRVREDGERVVLPLTFPDGTTAELRYPPSLRLERFTIRPYSSGRLHGRSPTPGRGDVVGRDFIVVEDEVSRVLARMREQRAPVLVAEYKAPGGERVGLWDLGRRSNVNYLGFQFGRWAVLVYDYKAAGAMTDEERASWVESFSERETDDGWLVLEGTGRLRLARAGEHAGPQLMFFATGTERGFGLYPGTCRPHRDQDRVVAGKLVSWRGGFANWCLSDSMRIHASGSRRFVGTLIRELEVRKVVLAS
jgi:hypothetical protein